MVRRARARARTVRGEADRYSNRGAIFIAEMLVRIYYETPDKTSYYIKATRNLDEKP